LSETGLRFRDALDLRRVNRDLDQRLLAALAVTLAAEAPVGEAEAWSARQVAGHLAEFPRFFAADLRHWKADPAVIVGRTHDHPGRLAAVAPRAVAGQTSNQLQTAVREALAALAAEIESIDSADLTMATMNVKYGEEPLTAFMERYVVGHKAGHLRQLEELLLAQGAEGENRR